MSKKLICCSFEKGIPYVLITLNNGVHPDRPGHISGTFKIDKETYNKACKNRVMFNDIFDNVIDIRMGWQNALADAISNAQNLNTEDVDIGCPESKTLKNIIVVIFNVLIVFCSAFG